MVVVRGGERSLDDAVLDRTVADCWAAHGFFGLSVFADAANRDIGDLARRTPLVRRPLEPRPGDYLLVGDDEIEPALAEVLSRTEEGELRLRMLPGPASSHPELHGRRQPAAT